jgi:CubicO group peptidase (beta-lactamase class C family)
VATLVGAALADGVLTDLEQTLAELLPDHRREMSPPTRAITLRQLMSMSSGVASDIPTWSLERLGRGDLVGLVLRTPPAAEPGERFVYSNVSAHLVAAALRRTLRAGRRAPSLLAYARERLFDPLGIVSRPAYEGNGLLTSADPAFARAGFAWSADAQGVHLGCFGLRLTVPDLVRLGELHRQHGSWDGRALFDPRWVEQLTTPALTNSTYGLLWWLTPFGSHRAYSAQGSGGQLLVVVPDLDAVVAVISANDAERPIDAPEQVFPLVNDVLLAAVR